MISFQKRVLSVALKFGVVLLMFQISRLLFLFLNFGHFSTNSIIELVKIFFFGTWFDFSAVSMVNILFVLLYLLPVPIIFNKRYINAIDLAFVSVNILVLLLNFIDCEYFKYINKRSTFDMFKYLAIGDDALVLLPKYIVDFWYVPLLWLLISIPGAIIVFRIEKKFPVTNPVVWPASLLSIPETLVILALLFVGARGLGLKPIQVITASRFTTTENFPLLLNTPFTMLHTMKDDGLQPVSYLPDSECRKLFNPVIENSNTEEERRDNVVIIILESFSFKYVGGLTGQKGYTPFLDSLMTHSLVFDHAYANGKKSIDAMPSVLVSIPDMIEEPYIISQYGGNRITGLPAVLRKRGYHTSYFHGGRNGTFRLDDFSKAAGVSHYFGMNEYTGPPAYDGDWGIFDEEFLQFFAHQLDTFPKPFFSCVFTLSSHHPYTIPEKHKDKFAGGEMPIYRTIEYADYSLKKFFETVSKSSWYMHTLFVITADHAAQEEDYSLTTYADRFHIPIVYFHPGDNTVYGRSSRITQQADIMPSVLDYLKIKGKHLCFGTSVFDSTTDKRAVQYLGGVYSIMQDGYCLQWDGEKTLDVEQLDSKSIPCNRSIKTDIETSLKTFIQQYNYRMINNELSVSE